MKRGLNFASIAALSLGGVVSAQLNRTEFPAYNPYPASIRAGSSPEADPELFIAAHNNPNASHSVNFDHNYSGNSSINGNWTWTVRVSDLEVPSNSSQTGPLSPNSRVAYTTYDFSWPEDGTLNQALQEETRIIPGGGPVQGCAYLFTAIFPQNVSGNYNEADGGNCTNVLGAECVGNLTRAIANTEDCNSNSVSLTGPMFQAACGGSFGAVRINGGYALGGYHFGNSSLDANTDGVDDLQKGQTYAYGLSFPYSADNLTLYNQAKDNVHVMILTGPSTNLLCNRAGNGSSLTGAAMGRGSRLGVAAAGGVALLAALLNFL